MGRRRTYGKWEVEELTVEELLKRLFELRKFQLIHRVNDILARHCLFVVPQGDIVSPKTRTRNETYENWSENT